MQENGIIQGDGQGKEFNFGSFQWILNYAYMPKLGKLIHLKTWLIIGKSIIVDTSYPVILEKCYHFSFIDPLFNHCMLEAISNWCGMIYSYIVLFLECYIKFSLGVLLSHDLLKQVMKTHFMFWDGP